MKKIMAIVLFMCVFFAACTDDQEEDISISEITIYNIPTQIPVFDNDTAAPLSVFKIYLNASNSMSEAEPPAAKGIAKVSEGTLNNGKYTVTIQLQNPNPPDEPDPNFDTGPWSGTASYFSVVISPQDVTGGPNTIWVKAGTTLNKGKRNCDWSSSSLMDFRSLIKNDPNDTMEFAKKTTALYTEIVCKDPEINK